MAQRDRVIIVGGGPVGYTTALILAQKGIPFVLLEAGHAVFDEPRAGTIHPPTLELYASVGAIDRFLDRGFLVHNYQYYDRTQARPRGDRGCSGRRRRRGHRQHSERH